MVTYLGEYFRVRLARALSPDAAERMVRLTPGVDVTFFRPGAGGAAVRDRLGLDNPARGGLRVPAGPAQGPGHADPGLAAGARRGERRGAAARRRRSLRPSPASADGPARRQRCRPVHRAGPLAQLPGYYDAADVFAMPCRTRRAGLDVEGLGIVYLEASATGLPVIGGDSGGAPDAILEGESGYVVGDVAGTAARLVELLADPAKARAMGEKGLAWVDREWRWELAAARLTAILAAKPAIPPAKPVQARTCTWPTGTRHPKLRRVPVPDLERPAAPPAVAGGATVGGRHTPRAPRSTACRCRPRSPWPARSCGCPAWR